jgi:hypothetical protein
MIIGGSEKGVNDVVAAIFKKLEPTGLFNMTILIGQSSVASVDFHITSPPELFFTVSSVNILTPPNSIFLGGSVLCSITYRRRYRSHLWVRRSSGGSFKQGIQNPVWVHRLYATL